MAIVNWFFVILILLTALITSLSFWSRKRIKFKLITLFIGMLCFVTLYFSLIEILSRAKPKNLEVLNKYADELTLLHVNWIEGEALYLLVLIEDDKEPRLYKFPWNAAQAQEFDEALEKGREDGEEVKIANPFYTSNTEERKTLIYSSPAKPLPEKEAPSVGITSYDPDAEKKSYDIKDSR